MSEDADPDLLEFVTLMAGGQSFGVGIRQVREIRRWSPVTALPHAPFGVMGVINLRGAVVPILDLSARLGLGPGPDGGRSVFVIAQAESRTVGLLVDSVSEIIGARRDQIRDLPTGAGLDGAQGVQSLIETGDGMIRVVDLRAVLPPLDAAPPS